MRVGWYLGGDNGYHDAMHGWEQRGGHGGDQMGVKGGKSGLELVVVVTLFVVPTGVPRQTDLMTDPGSFSRCRPFARRALPTCRGCCLYPARHLSRLAAEQAFDSCVLIQQHAMCKQTQIRLSLRPFTAVGATG